MFIPRFLALPLVLSLGVGPLAAQSTLDNHEQPFPPQSAQPGLRIGPLQDFHLHGTTPEPETYRITPAPGTYRKTFPSDQSTCYSIRGYRITRDDPESDSTRPSGYSTCQPSDRFEVKDAGEQQILPR
jgi:hypothetical protein